MSKTAHGCLTKAKLKIKDLPDNLKELYLSKNKVEKAVAAHLVEQHLEHLRKVKESYVDAYKNELSDYKQKVLASTVAHKLINKTKDKTNPLNTFIPKTLKALSKNYIQRIGSFLGLHSVAKDIGLTLTKEENKVLTNFLTDFAPTMVTSLEHVFKLKDNKYRNENYVQYFNDLDENGNVLLEKYTNSKGETVQAKLNSTLKGIIAAVAYEQLINNQYEMLFHRKESIANILGIDSKGTIPELAYEYLSDIGLPAETLAEMIGASVLNRLGIKASENTNHTDEERFKKSIGFLALGAMEYAGFIERNYVLTGEVSNNNNSNSPFGIKGLAAGFKINKNDVVRKVKAGENPNIKGTPATVYYSLKSNETHPEHGYKIAPSWLRENTKDFIEGNIVFNKIFGEEDEPKVLSFGKIRFPLRMRIKNNKYKASKRQSRNLAKYSNAEYQESVPTFELFFELDKKEDDNNPSFIEQILGIKDQSILLDIHEKSTMGVNNGIRRDIEAVYTYDEMASERESKGLSTKFRLPSFFYKTMRMGQLGLINPQQSKLHRALFSNAAFKSSFKLNNKTKINRFIEAVALSFDIEVGKEPITSRTKQREAFLELAKTDTFIAGLRAVRKHLNKEKLTTEDKQAIVNAVKLGDKKAESLKGLVEYARFLEHKENKIKEEFTTDMHNEIDGVANGIAITACQLLANIQNPDRLAGILMMAGINITNADIKLSQRLANKNYVDAYKRMGLAWVKGINEHKAFLLNEQDKNGYSVELRQLNALESILGGFTDEKGFVQNNIRKLSKYKVMQVSFGSSLNKQVKILVVEDIIENGIYGTIEKQLAKLANNPTDVEYEQIVQELSTLFDNVKLLININPSRRKTFNLQSYMTNNKLDINKLKTFSFNANEIADITNTVNAHIGDQLVQALEDTYDFIIKTRQPLIQLIGAQTAIYNHILKKKIKLKEAEVNRELTNKEIQDVVNSLDYLLPKVKTPLHTESDPSYLALAKIKKDKQYKEGKIESSFSKGTVSVLKGYVSNIPYLENPGVAPIVNIIHMLDSMVMNRLMETRTDFLNVHDGIIHGVDSGDEIEKEANRIFYELMTKYDMVHEIFSSSEEALNKAKANEDGVVYKDILPELIENMVISLEDIQNAFGYEYDKSISYDANKKAAIAYVKQFSNEDIHERVVNILQNIFKETKTIAAQVKRNKEEITPHIRQVSQYTSGGTGFHIENASTDPFVTINGVPILKANITKNDVATTKSTANDIISITRGSSAFNVSQDESLYDTEFEVSSKNAEQVFDFLLEMDKENQYGSVQLSKEHENHLRHIVNTLVKTVTEPIKMHIGEHIDNAATTGITVLGKSKANTKIFIQTQKKSTVPVSGLLGQDNRMSAAEVGVHEQIHAVLHHALNSYEGRHLRKQARMLYKAIKTEINSKYGSEAFRVFLSDSTLDIHDPANKYEVDLAKQMYEYVFEQSNNSDGTNTRIEELFAYGLTNESFRRATKDLTVSEKYYKQDKLFSGSLQDVLLKFIHRVMSFVYERVKKQQHSTNALQEIENLALALTEIDKKKKHVIFEFISDMDKKATDLSTEVDKKIINKVQNSKYVKAVKIIKQIPDLDNYISRQLNSLLAWYNEREYGIIHSIVTELKQNTDRVQPLHHLLAKRNRIIDNAKMEQSSAIKRIASKLFKKEISDKHKAAITKTLFQTGIADIFDLLTKDALHSYLSDATSRETRKTTLLNRLHQMGIDPKYINYYTRSSKALGRFIVTATASKDNPPVGNVHNITRLHGTKEKNALDSELIKQIEPIIAELVSLHALDYVSTADKQRIVHLIDTDYSGIENAVNLYNKIQTEFKEKLFTNIDTTFATGYIKGIYNDRVKVIQAPISAKIELENAGYVMSKTPIKADPAVQTDEPLYMFTSKLGTTNDLSSGIFSFTDNQTKGADAFQQYGKSYGFDMNQYDLHQIKQMENNATDIIERRLNNMFKQQQNNIKSDEDNGNYLIPLFDSEGNVIGGRYVMKQHTKDTLLEQHHNFDDVLAAMKATIIDKEMSPSINKEVIDALSTLAKKEMNKYSEAYVEISSTTDNPVYKDIWNRMPNSSKRYIYENYGGKLWVSKDIIPLAFGTREFSVTDILGSKPKERSLMKQSISGVLGFALSFPSMFGKQYNSPGHKQIVRAKALEDFMTQLTQLAKKNIVVRNVAVTRGNYLSNLAYLKSKGISTDYIITNAKKAIFSAFEYQQLRTNLDDLIVARDLTDKKTSWSRAKRDAHIKRLNDKITDLQNELALNPATKLIEAGLMPQLVDDVDTDSVQSPYKHNLNAAIDNITSRIPEGKIKQASKHLFLTEDSDSYKMLNNAVKMTDFVGRYILHNYYTENGMSFDDATAKVIEEFINFDLPTHQAIEYGNRIGLIWFSKYQLRVLKHIGNLLLEHPATTLTTFLFTQILGTDNVLNSIPGLTKDVGQMFGNPVSMFFDSLDDSIPADMLLNAAL